MSQRTRSGSVTLVSHATGMPSSVLSIGKTGVVGVTGVTIRAAIT